MNIEYTWRIRILKLLLKHIHLFLVSKEMKPCIQHAHCVGGRTIKHAIYRYVQPWYHWGHLQRGMVDALDTVGVAFLLVLRIMRLAD